MGIFSETQEAAVQEVLKTSDGYARVLIHLGYVCPHCGGWTPKMDGLIKDFTRPYDQCCENGEYKARE